MIIDIVSGFVLGILTTICLIDSVRNEMTYREVKKLVDLISKEYNEYERIINLQRGEVNRDEVRSVSEESEPLLEKQKNS